MDRNLPRGILRSQVTVSPFLDHHACSPSACFASSPFLHHSHSLSLPFLSHHLIPTKYYYSNPTWRNAHKTPGRPSRTKSGKAMPRNPVTTNHQKICLRATPQDFEIYAPHATFEDPLMRAHGVQQIKSAFYSLAKVFSESRIVDYSIQENVISPGKTEILIDNKQYYKFLGKDIDMISLIRLYTEDGKIVRHEDWWDKKPLWDRETVKTPLVGRMIEATRRASMLATHALMRFGKDPSN